MGGKSAHFLVPNVQPVLPCVGVGHPAAGGGYELAAFGGDFRTNQGRFRLDFCSNGLNTLKGAHRNILAIFRALLGVAAKFWGTKT